MDKIRRLADGYCISKSLHVAVLLGIHKLIEKDQMKNVDDLSRQLNVDKSILYRFMRALTYSGLFKEDDEKDGLFGHSELSLELINPGVSEMVLVRCSNGQYHAWDSLFNSITTGKPDHTHYLGHRSYYDYLSNHKQEDIFFSNTMSWYSSKVCNQLILHYNLYFNQFNTIVDLGGSQGLLMKEILKNNDNIKIGINFDLPNVIQNNNNSSMIVGQDPRYQDMVGDFFESVPKADCYVMKSVCHNWSDDKCLKLFNVISNNIKPNGKIIIFDYINSLSLKNENASIAFNDLLMFQLLGGQERNEQEWCDLINRSKFRIEKIINGGPSIQSQIILNQFNYHSMSPQL